MNASITQVVFAAGVDNPVLASPTNVQAQGLVKAIYFELAYASSYASNVGASVLHWCIQAVPNGNVTAVDPTAVGTSTAKKYVFKQGKLILSTLYNPWHKVKGMVIIPKKYARLMNADYLAFNLKTVWLTGNNQALTDCYTLKVIYKEIRGI